MHDAKPSRTALRVAMRRAAHQIVDSPKIFDDPLALAILGPGVAARVTSETRLTHAASKSLRAFLVARSRFAEDELAAAVARGVRQYVILGAGLDTFAYRNPHVALRVFEVDHPSTQAWKRERLHAAQIPIPESAVFAAVNFEKQSLAEGLREASFNTDEPAFFAWLGVVPYLTEPAFNTTISYIASLPAGSGVVFDYAVSRNSLSFLERVALDALSNRVAAAGEPFQLFFDPADLAHRLKRAGFDHIEDLTAAAINARYSLDESSTLRVRGGIGRLISAGAKL